MGNAYDFLRVYLNRDFVSAVFSGTRKPAADGGEPVKKVKVRPLLKKDTLFFQFEEFKGNQVFHKNIAAEDALDVIEAYMAGFRQLQLETKAESVTVLVSKKGKLNVKKKAHKGPEKMVNLTHNRAKNYLLKEGEPVPFLVDLGVMTPEGKVVKAHFDKFRQINRFLEFIDDVLPELEKRQAQNPGRELVILDFGCGKSYLTFAMYYYLHELEGLNVRMIGLDLKSEVIRHCNRLSENYGYEKLKFLEGDIADYTGVDAVDMVVTLHACDTATDLALAKAVRWNAKVILSVPCCQHELNRQIKSDLLTPILEYGIVKERIAALITDALRGQYLEQEGYRTQLLEFIEMEHTPKNILIRAVKTGKKRANASEIRAVEEALHLDPTLKHLLEEAGE